MSAGALAKVCGLPRTRIERIVSEQTGISADTALRLAKALGTTAQLWLKLQTDYDLQIAKRDLGETLDRIEAVNKKGSLIAAGQYPEELAEHSLALLMQRRRSALTHSICPYHASNCVGTPSIGPAWATRWSSVHMVAP